MNNPAVGGQARIAEIYTERRPCGGGGEEADGFRRNRQDGSCHAMLQGRVHAGVQVTYSSPNTAHGHGQLMAGVRARYANEVANDTRRITAAQMRNFNGNLPYQQAIRQRSQALHGNYGRDYNQDYVVLRQARLAVEARYLEYAAIGGAMNILPYLNGLDGRFAGAHAAGSDPVRAAINNRRDALLQSLDRMIAKKKLKPVISDDKKDDKKGPPPPPPPSSGPSYGPHRGSKMVQAPRYEPYGIVS
jgi:hypothetical protein